MQKRAAFFAVVFLGVLFCMPALSDPKKEKAKKLFDEGVKALSGHNYKQALEAFEKAYKTRPHWMVLAHIGNCNAKLSRPVEAIRALEQYLEEGGIDIPEDERQKARTLLMDQQKKVGQLNLLVALPGAQVTIDGDPIGSPPFDTISLKAGVYHIIVLNGDNVMEQDVTVVARSLQTVKFPEESTLTVAPAPVSEPTTEEPLVKHEPVQEPQPKTRPAPEPKPQLEPAEDKGKMDTETENEPKDPTSGPFWVAIGFAGAGVISAGIGFPFFAYYNSSKNNYAEQITGEPWDSFSWENTCDSGRIEGDTPEEQYFCGIEGDRREYERKAKVSLIPAIVGSGVAVVSTVLAVTYYLVSSPDSESANVYIAPAIGSSFSGISISGKF